MYKNKKFMCIIPARGGSKGLRHKNILPLAGKPLISYAINAAKESGIFDYIAVSTESLDIAAIVKKYGIEVIHRPASLATDKADVMDTMQHAILPFTDYDYVQLLEPTSPLVDGEDIRQAADMLIKTDADMIIGVCESKAPLGISKPLGDDYSMRNFLPSVFRRKGRQEVPKSYQINSHIYVGRWKIFKDNLDYWDMDVRGFIMPQEKSVHIDNPVDMSYAAFILEKV